MSETYETLIARAIEHLALALRDDRGTRKTNARLAENYANRARHLAKKKEGGLHPPG